MIVNVIALIAALFYTANIPIMVKFTLMRTGDINISAGAFAAKNGVSVNTSVRELIKRRLRKKKRSVRFPARAILKAIKFRRIDLTLSMPDAYHTALTCGAVSTALNALAPGVARVFPVFSQNALSLDATCIISVSVGKAFLAACDIALGAIKERIANGSARTN